MNTPSVDPHRLGSDSHAPAVEAARAKILLAVALGDEYEGAAHAVGHLLAHAFQGMHADPVAEQGLERLGGLGKLRDRGERCLLAVPSNTLVRDLDVSPPDYAGRGRPPMTPFSRLDRWRATLPEDAWTRIDVRDGEKGPLVVEVVKRRVQARTETGGTGQDELLFITREPQSDGKFKHDYYLSNADPDTSLDELARVTKAAHRIEECFRRGKSEAGLADYQVRTWRGWHHHQTLSLLAAWFLNQETRRGKNRDPGFDDTPVAPVARGPDPRTDQTSSAREISSSPTDLDRMPVIRSDPRGVLGL